MIDWALIRRAVTALEDIARALVRLADERDRQPEPEEVGSGRR